MVAGERSYDGDDLDQSWQYFHERPAAQETEDNTGDQAGDDSETVYVTDAEPEGERTVENVPMPGDRPDDVDGQSTWSDWEWSA